LSISPSRKHDRKKEIKTETEGWVERLGTGAGVGNKNIYNKITFGIYI